MMDKIIVSAPGKLMIFGEHAVVYGHPCIVTAVDQRIRLSAEVLDSSDFELEAPDVEVTNYKKSISELGYRDVPEGAQFIEVAAKNLYEKFSLNKGLRITTISEFSSKFGFGSSSASTVCVVKALSELFDLDLDNKEIFDLSYEIVLDIQGKGSGFDVAAAVFGGTLYFLTGGKIIEPLNIGSLSLVVAYSGIKADTVKLINEVKERFTNNSKRLDEIYTAIGSIVEKAKEALLKNDLATVGKLMNENQILLAELGVSIPKLDSMINAARRTGAYGAKLSGAGGGDCIIVLAPQEKGFNVEQAIISVGGEIIDVKSNEEGVRVE